MNKTTHLKLIKPAANTVNWGTAINQNFDKIDAEYSALYNQINTLKSSFSQLGMYFYDANYSQQLYLKAVKQATSNQYHVQEAYITDMSNDQTITLYQNGFTQSMGLLTNYTMFIVRIEEPSNVTEVYWDGVQYSNGDIAVKITRFDDITNKNISSFVKMAQTIGGFYYPVEYTFDTNNIPILNYQRYNALDTQPSINGPSLVMYPFKIVGNTVHYTYAHAKPGDNTLRIETDTVKTLSYPQITPEALQVSWTRGSEPSNISISNTTCNINTNISYNDYIATYVLFTTKTSSTSTPQQSLVNYSIGNSENKIIISVHDYNRFSTGTIINATVLYSKK